MKAVKLSFLLVLTLLLISVVVSATELWVSPAVDAPDAVVDDWAVTSSSKTHFTFAVPNDFGSFTSASVVVIGKNSKDSYVDLSLSVSQDALSYDANLSPVIEIPFSFTADALQEVDVSSVFPELKAGYDYVSLTFDTNFARILGLRFRYENTDLTSVKDAIQTETADRIGGDRILQQEIESEANARIGGDRATYSNLRSAIIAGDNTLQQRIDDETNNRSNADITLNNNLRSVINTGNNALQGEIVEESNARIEGDAALQTNINDESATRLITDNSLQAQIDSGTSCQGRKTYYLTKETHQGDTVAGACTEGYHVATLAEFKHLLSMDYVEGDFGVPIVTASGKTGWLTFSSSSSSLNDCLANAGSDKWTSASDSKYGYKFAYNNTMYSRTSGSMADFMEYFVDYDHCISELPVWCISD